jgi:hypothetical protein
MIIPHSKEYRYVNETHEKEKNKPGNKHLRMDDVCNV